MSGFFCSKLFDINYQLVYYGKRNCETSVFLFKETLKGGQMVTSELTIIIPIIIILLLTALMMFYFATELGNFELVHSRVFMMSLTSPSLIDGKVVRQELQSQIISTRQNNPLYLSSIYGPTVFVENPLSFLNRRKTFGFEYKFRLIQVERQWLGIVKSSVDAFLTE